MLYQYISRVHTYCDNIEKNFSPLRNNIILNNIVNIDNIKSMYIHIVYVFCHITTYLWRSVS